MIANQDREMIVRLARKYGVSSVFLFGSSAVEGKEPHDIDIGVRGIEPRLFFRFCGELLMSLSKPVDVINLLHRTRFTDLVEKNGVRIYG